MSRAAPWTIALASAAGVVALAAPLWPAGVRAGHPAAPLLGGAVVALCLAAAGLEAGVGFGPRAIAVLGSLVAFNSVLRFVEVLVPGPGEFSPIFALIVLAGYACGARFGFLTGALTLVVSALITGGVGPWLPYQMLAAGWVGQTAGWLPGAGRPRARPPRRSVVVGLAAFGAAWGVGYGIVLTLWDWQFRAVGAGAAPGEAWARFTAFYLASSLPFDAFRAAGNAALIGLSAPATLVLLGRLARPFAAAPAASQPPTPVIAAASGRAGRSVERSSIRTDVPTGAATDAGAGAGHHPRAWLAWLAAALLLGSATRHPLLLAEAWLAIAVVHGAAARRGGRAGWPVGRLGPWVIASTAAYTALMVHAGDTVLAQLPAAWPLVGGAITLEALVQGAANGLALVVLMAAFAAFEAAVPVRAMLALVPRAFGSLALAAAVALTAAPAMRRELAEVREALALRGRTAGLRGLAAAATPALVGGLERAVRLAESLAARGLAPAAPPPAAARAAVAAGWVLALLGGGATLAGPGPLGPALLAAGFGLAGAGIVAAGAGVRRTAWRRRVWRTADTALAGAAAAVAALALWPPTRAALAYSAFPRATWPPLDLAAVGGVALLALPAWRMTRAGGRDASGWGPRSGDAFVVAVGAGDADEGDGAPAGDAAAVVRADGFAVSYPGGNAEGAGAARGAEPAALGPLDAVLDGGITLVAGPSGAGKSTLLRSVCGLAPHLDGGRAAGRLTVAGRDPVAAGPVAMGAVAGFVADAPEAAFALDVVADEVAFGLELRAVPATRIGDDVASALAAVDALALAERSVATLSGGEAQRVAIAAALAAAPAVLALDEPTSQLDDGHAAEVLAALRRLADAGVAVLLAEHRLERVAPLADRLLWLPGGGAPARLGPPAAVLAAVDRPRPAAAPATVRRGGEPAVLACADVAFGYDGRPVLDRVDLTVAPGELVALMAPSGAGKTTLLRLAAGLLQPDRGAIAVAGRVVAGETPATIAGRLAYVPQAAGRLLVGTTVAEAVRRGAPAPDGPDGRARAARLEDLLVRLGVDHLTARHPLDLSAGERQRVALALALADGRPAAALDEPTRGLDAWALARLVDALHAACAGGAGVLVATHDRRLAASAHRVVVWSTRAGIVDPGPAGG